MLLDVGSCEVGVPEAHFVNYSLETVAQREALHVAFLVALVALRYAKAQTVASDGRHRGLGKRLHVFAVDIEHGRDAALHVECNVVPCVVVYRLCAYEVAAFGAQQMYASFFIASGSDGGLVGGAGLEERCLFALVVLACLHPELESVAVFLQRRHVGYWQTHIVGAVEHGGHAAVVYIPVGGRQVEGVASGAVGGGVAVSFVEFPVTHESDGVRRLHLVHLLKALLRLAHVVPQCEFAHHRVDVASQIHVAVAFVGHHVLIGEELFLCVVVGDVGTEEVAVGFVERACEECPCVVGYGFCRHFARAVNINHEMSSLVNGKHELVVGVAMAHERSRSVALEPHFERVVAPAQIVRCLRVVLGAVEVQAYAVLHILIVEHAGHHHVVVGEQSVHNVLVELHRYLVAWSQPSVFRHGQTERFGALHVFRHRYHIGVCCHFLGTVKCHAHRAELVFAVGPCSVVAHVERITDVACGRNHLLHRRSGVGCVYDILLERCPQFRARALILQAHAVEVLERAVEVAYGEIHLASRHTVYGGVRHRKFHVRRCGLVVHRKRNGVARYMHHALHCATSGYECQLQVFKLGYALVGLVNGDNLLHRLSWRQEILFAAWHAVDEHTCSAGV